MHSQQVDNRTNCRGFTLIEILIVMLITSILMLGISAAYRQAYLFWSNAESKRPIYYTARIITETLRQELSCLYFPRAAKEQESRPFELSVLPDGTTELTFYTLTPSWKASLVSSRIAKVRYSFTRDKDTGETLLERFEQLYAGEKMIGKESSNVIVHGLSDFRIWAADPNSDITGDLWKPFYNSRNTPPKALKLRLKWAATKEIPETGFQTSILIPSQAALMP